MSSAQQRAPEYAVKAAYLYNFAKYAKWPAEPPSTFNICVLGRDPFQGYLDKTVAGESLDGRAISIQRLSSLSQVHSCQVLFIGDSERGRLSSILTSIEHEPILTVSEIPTFLDHGGMIQFQLQSDRVRFAINLNSARTAKLNLSSDLLKVATNVEGK